MRFNLPVRHLKPATSAASPSAALPSSAVAAQRSQEDHELCSLLHRRLTGSFAIFAFLAASMSIITYRYLALVPWCGQLGLTLSTLIPAILLWRRRDLSLPALRRYELILLSSCAVTVWYSCFVRLGVMTSVEHLPEQSVVSLLRNSPILIFSDGSLHLRSASVGICSPIILGWGLFAVSYAVVIPNTWRRCATILGLITMAALACTLHACLYHAALRPALSRSLFLTFFVVTSFAACGLYGTHKLNLLRSAVLIAKQVGQYYLKQMIGKGGMGQVYLAQHRMLRRPCAVKLIHPEHSRDTSSLMRFEREVQAMAKLTHPNNVEVYDYGRTEDGMFYYVMEYLPGLSAEELIRKYGPVPPGRAIHLLRQVCGALSEAHSVGLIHRDIKPANIFIAERGRIQDVVKLLDFGIVQLASNLEPTLSEAESEAPAVEPADMSSRSTKLTQAGLIMGTPAYMSPEQARSEPADPRSDIYSIGAVAYYLLTGQPPFVHPTVAQMIEAHEKECPPPLSVRSPEVGMDLGAAVMRCLKKEPAERHQSVKDLERALSACQSAGSWDLDQAALWWAERKLPQSTALLLEETPSFGEDNASILATVNATSDLGTAAS